MDLGWVLVEKEGYLESERNSENVMRSMNFSPSLFKKL